MNNKEAIDELSVLSERISDGETVNVFVHDGNYGEAIDLAIKALEQTEVKGDLISREALKEHKFLTPQVKVIGGRRCGKTREQIIEAYQKGWNDCIDAIIDNAPTVTVLKDERPKACFNCEHCCVLEFKNNGEILIKCNLGNGQK